MSSTVRYYLRLSNVTIGGLPGLVVSACQTSSPVTITVASPDDQPFDVVNGGHLTGSYSIVWSPTAD